MIILLGLCSLIHLEDWNIICLQTEKTSYLLSAHVE